MNKKVYLLLLLLLACISLTIAQAKPGIKMGIDSSNISKTNLDSKSGLYVRAFVKIPISDYFEVRTELLYSNQGGVSNSSEYGV